MSTPEVEQSAAPSEPVEGAADLLVKAILAAVAVSNPPPELEKPTTQAPTDAETALRNYPDMVGSDYVVEMRAVVDGAVDGGDVDALIAYASRINPEVGRPLMQRAQAFAGTLAPELAAIVGSVVADNALGDGAAVNTVKFICTDQHGDPFAGSLTIACDSATAANTPTTGTAAADGTLDVNVNDTVAEPVVVTATSGTITGSVTVTFA